MLNRRTLLQSGAALATIAATAGITPYSKSAFASGTRIRRNATQMNSNDSFFTDYADAVQAMHDLQASNPTDQRNWRNQSLIHVNHCPHRAPDFLAWHRIYLSFYERICGELIGKPEFALAYWDWTNNSGRLPTKFFNNGPLNVTHWNDPSNASSPNWSGGAPVRTIGSRAITATIGLQDDPQRGGAFTSQNIASIQRLGDFSRFQGRLEDSPHNNGHVVTGAPNGHMISGMSPLDPCFWLHHCNVDRLWAEWQRAGNTSPSQTQIYNGQFVDETGAGQNAAASNAVDFEAMGFTYDTLASEENLAKANQLDVPTTDDQTIFGEPSIEDTSVILGNATNTETSYSQIATSLPVVTKGLVDELFNSRKFRPTSVYGKQRIAVEQRRILAELKDVKAKGDVNQLLINVFVNCPYLSPETPYDDEHYAGSFSFFMKPDEDGHHGSRDFLVDITEPLRKQAGEGRIATDEVEVQLMPIPASKEAKADDAEFTVGSIELIGT